MLDDELLNEHNPFRGGRPETADEAHYNGIEAQALFDTYMFLRDADYDVCELQPLLKAIAFTTIYSESDPESLFSRKLKHEKEDRLYSEFHSTNETESESNRES